MRVSNRNHLLKLEHKPKYRSSSPISSPRYGAREADLPALRLTHEDFIINIPDELSSRDIIAESRE
jgi:hypothetical protein